MMTVSFTVYGSGAEELDNLAAQRLAEFGAGRVWAWDIRVEPSSTDMDGTVHMWTGEVTAREVSSS